MEALMEMKARAEVIQDEAALAGDVNGFFAAKAELNRIEDLIRKHEKAGNA